MCDFDPDTQSTVIHLVDRICELHLYILKRQFYRESVNHGKTRGKKAELQLFRLSLQKKDILTGFRERKDSLD